MLPSIKDFVTCFNPNYLIQVFFCYFLFAHSMYYAVRENHFHSCRSINESVVGMDAGFVDIRIPSKFPGKQTWDSFLESIRRILLVPLSLSLSPLGRKRDTSDMASQQSSGKKESKDASFLGNPNAQTV